MDLEFPIRNWTTQTHRGFWVGIIERTAVADYVIDANANGKCNTTIDRFSVHFFGVKL